MPLPMSNFTLPMSNFTLLNSNTKIKRKDTPQVESSSQNRKKANTSDYGIGIFCSLSYRILSFGHEKTSPIMGLPSLPVGSHKVRKMQRPPRDVILSGSRTDGLLPI